MTISRRSLLVSALLSAVMLSACGKKEEAPAAAAAPAPAAPQVKEYVVGTDAAYAPFEFENEKKEV